MEKNRDGKQAERVRLIGLISSEENNNNVLFTEYLDWEKAHPQIFDYLNRKTTLYGNYQESHFAKIPSLYELLAFHMYAREKWGQSKKLTNVIKNTLIDRGVFNDPALLEFLLLISEKERMFNPPSQDSSDEDTARYYFEQYKGPGEQWHTGTFRFYTNHWSTSKINHNERLEEIAIRLIAESRGQLAKTVEPQPTEAVKLITETDIYFQKAFLLIFKRPAPISLKDVTLVTKAFTEHADKIIQKSFIHELDLDNPSTFARFVLHEGLHLCFEGFDEKMIEEAYIEFIINGMFSAIPPQIPIAEIGSEVYHDWLQSLQRIIENIPGSEEAFTKYFSGGDIKSLKLFLKKSFSEKTRREIEKDYVRGLSGYLDTVNSFLNSG